jgi:hypothetical protein
MEKKEVQLTIDWEKSWINPEHAIINTPYIKTFREERTFQINQPIPVEPGKGWLLIISEE